MNNIKMLLVHAFLEPD